MLINKKQSIAIIIFLFLIAFILRVAFLEALPPGIVDDEAALGYNAYLIAKTGKDEWGNFFPSQFRSFGDYKLPVYIYLSSIVFLFFPLSILGTKIISVLLGSLTIPLLCFLVFLIFKNNKDRHKIALFSGLVLTFNPWHIGLSRIASEVNVGLFFFIGALSLFLLFLENQSKKIFLFLSLFFSLICFYSYHTYRVLVPAVLFFLYFLYKKENIKMKRVLVKSFLSLTVLTLFLFVATKGKFLTRLYQFSLFSNQGVIDSLNEFRGDCLTQFPPSLCKIFFNKPTFWIKKFAFNYVNHLSPQFLFFPDFEKGYPVLPHYSCFYLLDLIFVIIGVVVLSWKKEKKLLLFLLLIAPFASALTAKYSFTRAFPLVLPITIFSGLGMFYLFNFLKQKKLFFFSWIFIFIYCFSLIELLISYCTYFPLRQAKYSHYEYKPLFQYLKTVEANYDHIYISKVNHDSRQYIFYLFYFKIGSEEYFNLDRKAEVEERGWVWVKKLGKLEFINQLESLEKYPEKSLLIIDPKGVKQFPKSQEVITYPSGEPAFNIYDLDKVKYLKRNEEN